MTERRTVADLVSDDDAWPGLVAAVDGSTTHCVLLPSDDPTGACLHQLQVSTRSVLGALAFHASAVLIDHGWIRLFGSGSSSLPSIATANPLLQHGVQPQTLIVGEDVLGGKFALNGGGLYGAPGEVNFWAPDTLKWEPLELGYGDFVYGLIGGGGAALYDTLRWPGWEVEVSAVEFGYGLMLYPPPCTVEGRDTANVSRRPVPRPRSRAGSVLLRRRRMGRSRFGRSRSDRWSSALIPPRPRNRDASSGCDLRHVSSLVWCSLVSVSIRWCALVPDRPGPQ